MNCRARPGSSKAAVSLRPTAVLVCTVWLSLCPVSYAQQSGKLFRIGFLDQSTASGSAVLIQAFRQELNKLGWVEGKNITIEYRFAEHKNDNLPVLAAELVRVSVDLIVVAATPAAVAAKNATSTIPIVMTTVADPVGAGLIRSLAQPGANVTGMSSLSPGAKQQKARGSQGCDPQNFASRVFAEPVGNRPSRPPAPRDQACGSGPKLKIRGDRDST